jgi:hypothetical protein
MSYPPQPPQYPPPASGPPDDPWGTTGRVPPVSGMPVTPPSGPLPHPSGPLGAPPKKRPNSTLIAAIVGVAVVLVIGCCTGLYIIGSEQDPDGASPGVTATAGSVQSEPTATSEAGVPPAAPTSQAAEPSPSGTPAKTVTMPKVVGENAAIADDKLRKLGFTNIQYGSQDENDTWVVLLQNWTVAKQSAKAGSKVSTDTLIVLTCTKEN